MTTSHEPSASQDAEGLPDDAKDGSNATPQAQETTDDASDAPTEVGATRLDEDALEPGVDGLGAEDDAEDDDAYYEGEYAEGAMIAFFRRWISRRVLLVAGAVVLSIALIAPMAFVAFGARGLGPLAALPTPTIIPTATATPAQKVTLQDPLTKRSTRWTGQQNCSIREDGYHITDNNICYLAGAPIRDSYITVTVVQTVGVDDLSYGITLRRADKGSYYSFEIDGSGNWYFYKAADSVLTLLASHAANPSINKGLHVANTLQVRATGRHFEFFVNDVKVGQVDDSSYAEGVIGLGSNDQLEVVYTNFILSQPA
jgi:hypothetical protein